MDARISHPDLVEHTPVGARHQARPPARNEQRVVATGGFLCTVVVVMSSRTPPPCTAAASTSPPPICERPPLGGLCCCSVKKTGLIIVDQTNASILSPFLLSSHYSLTPRHAPRDHLPQTQGPLATTRPRLKDRIGYRRTTDLQPCRPLTALRHSHTCCCPAAVPPA